MPVPKGERKKEKRERQKRKRWWKVRNGRRRRGGENKTRNGKAENAEYIIPRKKMNHSADGISTTECDGRSNL